MPSLSEVTGWSLSEAAEQVRRREVSPVELTQACLEQIERRNAELNVFITVTAEQALAEARQAEAEIAAGNWRGPLHGIPVSLKDIIDTAGVRTTAASAIHAERVPAADAEVVQRLRAAGAVFVGKTNLHEFAYGGSSLVSHFGPMKNPHNPVHTTGGSSGGSAAAVAAGMCFASIGTDTAGSVRLPAACCGVAGLKPTHGLVSVRGVLPLSWSLDHVGPIARTAEDCALVLDVIANHPAESSYAAEKADAKPLRIGVAWVYFFDGIDPEVSQAVTHAVSRLADAFGGAREVRIPVDEDRTLFCAESYNVHKENVEKSPELYQPETLRRIMTGKDIRGSEYVRRKVELEEMRRDARRCFADVDVVVTPTVPEAAPPIAAMQGAELRPMELRLLRNTRPFNVLGVPAISIHCGATKAGLPIGVQLAAAPGNEAAIIRAARVLERD